MGQGRYGDGGGGSGGSKAIASEIPKGTGTIAKGAEILTSSVMNAVKPIFGERMVLKSRDSE
jgi:hypothetical protein